MRAFLPLLLCLTVPALSANVPSSVIELNDRFMQVKGEGYWFVEFYAPWCAHCKRLLPIWEHVGHAIADKNMPVRMGKLDCTRFPSVASQLGISGYPTIIFFRNGKELHYEGERSKEAMLDYAHKASSPVVEKLANAVKLNDVRRSSKSDPAFVMIGESAGEGDDMFIKYTEAAEALFAKSRFYSIPAESAPSNVKETGARVVVFKDDTFFPYKGDGSDLSWWTQSERWPLLPKAVPSNIADMAGSGKLLVLLVINQIERLNATTLVGEFWVEAVGAALAARQDEHLSSRFQFAWLDGSDIANSIVMGTITQPGMLVFNHSSYEFYECLDAAEEATKDSIIQWLRDVATGQVAVQGGRAWWQRTKRIVWELYTNVANMFATQPLLSSCLFGVPIAFLSIITYSICSADFSVERDEIYPDEEDEEEMEESDVGEEDVHRLVPDHDKHE